MGESQIGKPAAIGERTATLALISVVAATIVALAFGAPPALAQEGVSGGAELAQGPAQTTEDGPSWLPVYVGLAGLAVGLSIVLLRRGRRRVGRWLASPLGRAVASAGKFARSLVPLVLVPVEAVSTVARWRPSRPEAVGRRSGKETAVVEPEEDEEELTPPSPPRDCVESLAQEEAPVQAPTSVDGEAQPPRFGASPVAEWERCEIEWWHGHIKSDFYAVAFRSTGEWYVAERSPSFRWRHDDPPGEGGAGREEHAHLVGQLVRDGWEPVGNGPLWYQTRFRRPVPASLGELAETIGSQGTGAGS